MEQHCSRRSSSHLQNRHTSPDPNAAMPRVFLSMATSSVYFLAGQAKGQSTSAFHWGIIMSWPVMVGYYSRQPTQSEFGAAIQIPQ